MQKSKLNYNHTFTNNFIDVNNPSYNITKIHALFPKNKSQHHFQRNYSFTKYSPSELLKKFSNSYLSPLKNKNPVNISTVKPIYINNANYIPLPIKKKNYLSINVNVPRATLLKRTSSNKSFGNTIQPEVKNCNTISIQSITNATNSPKIFLHSESSTQSTDDQRKLFDQLQREIGYLKSKNNSIKKHYESKLKTIINDKNNLYDKYITLLKNYNNLKSENENLKCKEVKMMRILFNLKQQGINIDETVNRVMSKEDDTERYENNNIGNNSTISLTSVTFPDKVICTNNSYNLIKVPKMDFSKVPYYESREEDNDNNNYEKNKYNSGIAYKGNKKLIKNLSLKDIQHGSIQPTQYKK